MSPLHLRLSSWAKCATVQQTQEKVHFTEFYIRVTSPALSLTSCVTSLDLVFLSYNKNHKSCLVEILCGLDLMAMKYLTESKAERFREASKRAHLVSPPSPKGEFQGPSRASFHLVLFSSWFSFIALLL